MLQLCQQPALFDGCLRRTGTQRAIQQQRFGLRHLPDGGPHGVSPQAAQGGDPLVPVDNQVASRIVGHADNHDGNLLTHDGQRSQQSALLRRTPCPQVFITDNQLVKLQVHGFASLPSVSDSAAGRSILARDILSTIRWHNPYHHRLLQAEGGA